MKMWEVMLGTDDLGGNVTKIYGLAETGKEATEKALNTEDAKAYKGVYIAELTELGEQAF